MNSQLRRTHILEYLAQADGPLSATALAHTLQVSRVSFTFPSEVKWTADGEFGGARRQVDIVNHHQAVEILVPKTA